MTCPCCGAYVTGPQENFGGCGTSTDVSWHLASKSQFGSGGGGGTDPRNEAKFSRFYGSAPKQSKLERAQAYALEVRKRKFQVKRITGDQHG